MPLLLDVCGLKTFHDGLFQGIAWGGPDVLVRSLVVVPGAVLAEPLSGIDTMNDLEPVCL
jgi:hypothetical protein